MKSGMNKKGQFYIIAAVLIALAIAGLTGVTTYAAIKSNPRSLDSLSSDLQNEGPRVIDYGIFQRKDLTLILNNFTENDFAPYFLKKVDNSNVAFIYGNKTDLYMVQYNTTKTGTISTSIGNIVTSWEAKNFYSERFKININPTDNHVEVIIATKSYDFELQEGEMFYFIMVQEKDGERYVQKN